MLDDDTVRRLERHWDDGWNKCDVDIIMEPFAEDVVFSSPFVTTLTGDPEKSTIEGHEALRSYVADSLRRMPGLRYTLDSTCVGTDSIILQYTVHLPDGKDVTGADSMRVGKDRKVIDWRCHFPYTPADVQHLIHD